MKAKGMNSFTGLNVTFQRPSARLLFGRFFILPPSSFRLVAHRRGLGRGGKEVEGFLLVSGKHDMLYQAEHFEELNSLIFYVGEHHAGFLLLSYVNDAEENGDSDAVDDTRVAKIDHERTAA